MLNTDPIESQNEMMRWMIYYMVNKLGGFFAIDFGEMRKFFTEENPKCMVMDIDNGIAFKVIVPEEDIEVVDTANETSK